MELCVLMPPQASYLWSSQLLNRAHDGHIKAVPLFNLKKKEEAFHLYKYIRRLANGTVKGNEMFKKIKRNERQ